MEGRRRRQSRRPEARGWLRSGGKGREGAVRLIPSHGSGGDGLSWPGRDGVRRRAAADMRRRCSACLRPGFEGKKGMRSSGTLLPTSARAAVLRNGGSTVACARGGGNGGSGERRRRCRAEERAWGGGAAGGCRCGARGGLCGLFYRWPRRWRGAGRRQACRRFNGGGGEALCGVNGGSE